MHNFDIRCQHCKAMTYKPMRSQCPHCQIPFTQAHISVFEVAEMKRWSHAKFYLLASFVVAILYVTLGAGLILVGLREQSTLAAFYSGLALPLILFGIILIGLIRSQRAWKNYIRINGMTP